MYVAMILYSYGYLSKTPVCMTILNLIFLNGLLALRWKNKDIFLSLSLSFFFFSFLTLAGNKRNENEKWKLSWLQEIYIYISFCGKTTQGWGCLPNKHVCWCRSARVGFSKVKGYSEGKVNIPLLWKAHSFQWWEPWWKLLSHLLIFYARRLQEGWSD